MIYLIRKWLFLRSLKSRMPWFGPDVRRLSGKKLLHAMRAWGFTNDFKGWDHEIVARLRDFLLQHDCEDSWWGQIYIDLWYGSNFGNPVWEKLISSNPDNVRWAIEHALIVQMGSGAIAFGNLARMIRNCNCEEVALKNLKRHPPFREQVIHELRRLSHGHRCV